MREQPETFLTRAEMAKALGKSKTTIRRWEASGKLRPTVNEHGVHLFRVADAKALNGGAPVRALGQARAYVPSAARVDGELAAEIFERLERRESPVHIVTACRVHPDVVEGMVVRWARLQKGIFVDGIQVRAILAALKLHRARDADDLVRRVQRHVEREAKCMACHARPPTRCHAAMSGGCSACSRSTASRSKRTRRKTTTRPRRTAAIPTATRASPSVTVRSFRSHQADEASLRARSLAPLRLPSERRDRSDRATVRH